MKDAQRAAKVSPKVVCYFLRSRLKF